MASFLDTVQECFGDRDLYSVLGVSKSAGDPELKKAYYRLSLRVHPDRVAAEEVSEATNKFQVLGKIYSVLTDRDKRAVYDEEGVVEEEDASLLKPDRDWTEYWRLLFKEVTVEDIKAFEGSYKGSEEEKQDVMNSYLGSQGDMDKILEGVLCTRIEDEPRFREMISGWITEGKVPAFPLFVDEPERKRKSRKRWYEKEFEEAKKMKEEAGASSDCGDGDLKSLILSRQKSRESQLNGFFDSLEQKYVKKPKKEKVTSKTGEKSASAKKGKKSSK